MMQGKTGNIFIRSFLACNKTPYAHSGILKKKTSVFCLASKIIPPATDTLHQFFKFKFFMSLYHLTLGLSACSLFFSLNLCI